MIRKWLARLFGRRAKIQTPTVWSGYIKRAVAMGLFRPRREGESVWDYEDAFILWFDAEHRARIASCTDCRALEKARTK